MSPARGAAILAGGVVAAILLVVATSPVTCPMVPSMDTCRALPLCSHVYIDGLDGPSWRCKSRFTRD